MGQPDVRAPLPPSRGASPPSSPHPATRLAAPSPSRVSPRSGTAKGGHKQHHRYQRHRAGAGKLCGPCSGPLARRPGTWRPHTAPRPRLAGQNRRHRVGTLYGGPGLTEAGLGGAGWLGCPPPAVCQVSGVGKTITGRQWGRVGRPIRLLAGGHRQRRNFGRPRRLQPGRAVPAGSSGRKVIGPTPEASRGRLFRGSRAREVRISHACDRRAAVCCRPDRALREFIQSALIGACHLCG